MNNTVMIKNTSAVYTDRGSGDIIIILHGWGSQSGSWSDVQNALVQRGYRVIVPDLPGFGASDEPPAPWSLADYSSFLHTFIETVGIRQFTLAGHSFGGRIAIDYAIRYPQKISSLILMDAAGITRHKTLKIKLFLILTKMGNLIFTLPVLSALRRPTQKIWYRFTREHDYYQASGRMRKTMKRVMDENLRIHLPHITQATLILWGEKDRATPLADGLIIHKSIPLTHLHVFSGLGHAINLEAPTKVAQQIDLFLKKY